MQRKRTTDSSQDDARRRSSSFSNTDDTQDLDDSYYVDEDLDYFEDTDTQEDSEQSRNRRGARNARESARSGESGSSRRSEYSRKSGRTYYEDSDDGYDVIEDEPEESSERSTRSRRNKQPKLSKEEQEIYGLDANGKHRKKKKKKDTTPKKPKTGKNREILVVMYAFIFVFVAAIGYLIYFDAVESKTVIYYAGNVHLEKLQDKTARGSILSSDGEVLAETVTDEDGNSSRSYPYSNVFAHVVGTSEINSSGLEYTYDDELLTSSASIGTQILSELKNEKIPGDDVVTTLDAQLQQAAYDALGDNDGVVVAIEPSTGRVLAMVSKPDYDPNTLEENYDSIIADEDSKVLLNQATQGLFTPGSIFKIVTSLEYIRENSDYSSYSFTCTGSITLTGETLSCYHGTSHGYLDFTSSFAKSCNSSFANIGTSLDVTSFSELAETLLFNQELPTDISAAQSSFSLSTEDSGWLVGATAIGQGNTTMTPLHAAMLVSAIANDGVLMEPYLVDSVQSADGDVVESYDPVTYGSLMTEEEAQILTEMMVEVTTSGTASSLGSLSYTVAGKTGTAEIDDENNNAWFVGFAPADDPQIVICVLVEDTQQSSSYTAVPIAEEILEAYFE